MQLPRRTTAQFLVAILLLSTLSPASAFADTAFSLHAVRYNLTYVAGQLASFFSDLADSIASHIPVTSLTASAAAPAPSPVAPPTPALDFLATTTPEASTPPTTTAAPDAPQTTIIQQPVIERIVERTVPAPSASGISEQTLAGRLASLKDDLLLRIAAVASAPIAFSGPAATTPLSTATFAPSQRIDQLTNTSINTPTITGGTISGASVSGYLPLSGGTLTGTLSGTDLNLSGVLTAGTLSVAGVSSGGAVIAPYFSATSTTATSTFAGGLSGPGNFAVQQGSGRVGIGTTSPSELLHVSGSGLPVIKLESTDSLGSEPRVDILGRDDVGASMWGFFGLKGGGGAGSTAVVSGALTAHDYFLKTNNAIRVAIKASTGFVGIGTTTPWGKLSIKGNGTGTGLAFAVADSANTPRFVIQDNGNVGIGTTSPLYKLDVRGSLLGFNVDTPLHVTSDANYIGMFIDATKTDGTGQSSLFFGKNGAKSFQLGSDLSQNGTKDFFLWDSTNATTRLYVSNAGNVGIGTTSPAAKLEVSSSGSGNPVSFYMDGDRGLLNAQAGNIGFRNKSTNIASIDGYTGATGGSINYGQLVFSTANAGSLIERMRIIESGNVGIGTTSPTNKLEVAGNAFFGGALVGTSTLALTGTTGTTTIASGQGFTIGGSQFVVQQGSGNVGIGTASPVAVLSVQAAGGRVLRLGTASSFADYTQQDTNQFGWLTYAGVYVQSFDIANGRMSIGAGGLAPLSTLDVLGNLAVGSYAGTAAAPSNGLIVSGNVGIGTTTPWGKLSITGSGTGTGLAFAVADSANSPKFVIQDNGNVGIGTASLGSAVSDAPLNVVTNADNGIKISRSDMGGSQYLALYATSSPTIPYGNVISSVNNDLSLYTQFRQFFTAGGGGWGNAFEYGVATPMSSSGGGTFFNAAVTYAPSSGTGTFYGTNLSTNLNQSGSAAQNYTGLHVNVIETSFLGSDGRLLDVQKNSSSVFVVKNSGNVGIGTTTPTAQLSTTGTVRFSNFGAGTLTTDASGNLSVSSDERLKNIDGGFTRGLADVVKLSPIQYHWNTTSGLDTSTQYAGFSAQNVQTAIPEAVGSSTNGYLTLQDRPLIAALVNAVKELAQRFSDLAEHVVTRELTFDRARGIELDVEKLCIGSTCLTEQQIKAILAATGQDAVSPSMSALAGTPQAPVLELNGNASSTIEIGDTFNDLGARIVAPESDLNLGIVILLDGATTTAISIDSSHAGEHVILYTITSPTSGLTGSVMRTVIVSPAELSPAPAEDTNPFTAQPANDNASSTSVLIAEPAVVSL